jgi:hypothetical protein
LPCGITKKGKCMFLSTEKFLDILARRGNNPALPNTNSECTHVCEHWNFEGESKDTYNFNQNWWKQYKTNENTAELLKISHENYDNFKEKVQMQINRMQVNSNSETEPEKDVVVIQEAVNLESVQGSANVSYSRSTAQSDLFPASDKDIAAIIPVYLSMVTQVAQCDICSQGTSEVLNVCDAGHYMCKTCLDNWTKTFHYTEPTCPFCRRIMCPYTMTRRPHLNTYLQNQYLVTTTK